MAITAVVCVAMIAMALLPEFFPKLPSQWRLVGIAGLASCVGLAELRRRGNSREITALLGTNIIDPLTGLWNRRGFSHEIQRQLSHLHRQGVPVSILAIDIDDFTQVNSKWGSSVGDYALRAIANTITNTLREFDMLTRCDGDGFIAILPSTKLADAESAAERVRAAIEELAITRSKVLLQLTASVGVAAAVTLDTEASLLERADASLSNAKRLGKNRSCSQSMKIEQDDRPLTLATAR
jgi:diguanylate cyclase (GGDEF)-like protein